MKRPRSAVVFSPVLFILCCLPAAPLLAQPAIGGNTCSSATLSGTVPYAFSLTGRQVTSSGTFLNVFQGNGVATFNGLSKVTMTLTAGTLQSVETVNWAGTYTMQANCAGVITITTGGSATLNILSYDEGNSFLVTGTDATYSYSGSGSSQPSSCSTSTLAGVYTFNATGYILSNSSISASASASGLLQFDGQGNITANLSTGNLTGTYSMSSNCLGSGTLSSSSSTGYVMNFSVTSANSTSTTELDVTLAQSGKLLLSGSAHAIYGQPTATTTAANLKTGDKPAAEVLARLLSDAGNRGGK